MPLSGSEVGQSLIGLSGKDRELQLLSIYKSQGLVSFAGGGAQNTIVSAATIDKKNYILEIKISPFVAALGTPDDPFPFPAWPWTYQTIADDRGVLLPTRKISLLVAKQAQVRIDPHPFPTTNPVTGVDDGGKYNESSGRYVESYQAITNDLSKTLYKPGLLVSSPKKDVVVGPDLDGSKVAIFGWFFKNGGQTDSKIDRWQPYSTIHESTYADYSHGWRVVSKVGVLNGSPVNVDDLCNDEKLWPLVSDQGPFIQRFPSIVASSTTTGGKVATAAGFVGGAAMGGVIGFVFGGPVGAAFGAVLGGVFGRNA